MASRPGGGGGGGLGFDMEFLKSKPGMILAGAVVLGVVAISLVGYGHNWGAYYYTCPATYVGCGGYTHTECEVQQKLSEGRKDQPSCPFAWIATISVVFIALAWVGTVILLIVIVVLRQKPPQLPFLGGAIAAGVMGFSALLMLVFVIWAYVSKFPCSNDVYACSFHHTLSYLPLHMLFGMFFAVGTTVALAMFAVMIRRGGRVGPMMGGGGRMAQPQPTAPDAKHHHHHQHGETQPAGY